MRKRPHLFSISGDTHALASASAPPSPKPLGPTARGSATADVAIEAAGVRTDSARPRKNEAGTPSAQSQGTERAPARGSGAEAGPA